eukprot:CAMPEP_0177668168 /NCGR_PEP_ID=MMETSP0447-20121125/22591_1 /TAXON_ID=0 /ORGANISM="Stygamoeba regulata, Strain BSH-02190019" /LENGTH=37 /DNA_ID= /DNA_START= /DNA_END= /DNA_ORIENTATION=
MARIWGNKTIGVAARGPIPTGQEQQAPTPGGRGPPAM